MITDYASKLAASHARDAQLLEELTGCTVTVDKHGMAKINAQHLLDSLIGSRTYRVEDATIDGIIQPNGEPEVFDLADLMRDLDAQEAPRVFRLFIGQSTILYDGVTQCVRVTRLT